MEWEAYHMKLSDILSRKDCILCIHVFIGCNTSASFNKSKVRFANMCETRIDVWHVSLHYMVLHIEISCRDFYIHEILCMSPVTMTQGPAPSELLQMLSCWYKTSCGSQCGCSVLVLQCVLVVKPMCSCSAAWLVMCAAGKIIKLPNIYRTWAGNWRRPRWNSVGEDSEDVES